MCPICGSRERHRALKLYLEQDIEVHTKPLRLLHAAPERSLAPWLQALTNVYYTSIDLRDSDAGVLGDLARLPFAEGSFDLVICSHVLSEIPDDVTGLRELLRVLDIRGQVLLLDNRDLKRAATFEDCASVTDPTARLLAFGSGACTRVYGRDFVERVRSAGFHVTEVNKTDELGPNERERLAIPVAVNATVFVCEPLAGLPSR